MGILIIPLLSTLVVGLLLYLVLGNPIAAVMTALQKLADQHERHEPGHLWRHPGCHAGLRYGRAPVDKTAYTFGLAMLAQKPVHPHGGYHGRRYGTPHRALHCCQVETREILSL